MKKLNFKALTLPFFVAMIVLLPFSTTAQGSDGFFRANESENYQNRADFIGLSNQPFGTEAPVGSGLLVMAIAGAGYVALKRKRSNKTCRSYKTYMLSLAMLLAFTGCKKKIEPVVNSGETVHITLNVGNGNRHIIEPNENGYVPVSYSAGDVIYVGDGTQCVGQLSWYSYDDNNNSIFRGSINEPSGNKIYFYFIGGKNDVVASGTTSFTVDISDQHTNLPVLSCKEADYYSGKTEFNCMLENKCALVEFKFENSTTDKIAKISNMLCEAKIDFANGCITPTGKLDAIALYNDPNDETVKKKWAILLPGEEKDAMGMVENGTQSLLYDDELVNFYLYNYYDNVTVWALKNGDYKYGDNAVIVSNVNPTNNVFTVSKNGNVVRFAPGNLQYKAYENKWRFAKHQWDFVGGQTKKDNVFGNVYENNTKCDNINISNNYSGWIDLFGWGCTGYQDLIHPQPSDYCKPYCAVGSNSTSTESSNINFNYGPAIGDLIVSNKSDWGCVNITYENSNDPNSAYKWRTLTYDEWRWMIALLKTYQKVGYATLTYNDEDLGDVSIKGMVILPYYSETIAGFVGVTTQAIYTANSISEEDWGTKYNNKNALFLPITIQRYNTTLVHNQRNAGLYWSSSVDKVYSYNASYMSFTSSSQPGVAATWRSIGMAVRLVR